MAQLVSPGRSTPSGAVTVADLLSRNAPVPAEILGSEPTPAVSVGSLLRREGRASEAEPDGIDGPRGGAVRGVVVRSATIVAGTALVAGSAFGGAVLVETFLGDPEPMAGTAPGTGTAPAPAAAPGALADRAAGTGGGPDAGTGAPTAWTEVAFPTAAKAVTGGTQARPGTASPAAASPARSTPAASASDQNGTDQQETADRETSQEEASTTPATSASTAGSTSGETPSSSSGTAKEDGGLLGAVVDTTNGLLGLG